MEVNEVISKASESVRNIRKGMEKKYSRKLRQNEVDIAIDVNECIGRLGFAMDEYARVIKTQSRNIREGMENGYDTTVQERVLMSSARGYLVVRDALFALKTLRNFDSFLLAEDMLDCAALTMQGKKESLFSKLAKLRKKYPDYSAYFSVDAASRRDSMVDSFFKELVLTGDIAECVKKNKRNFQNSDAEITRTFTNAPTGYSDSSAGSGDFSKQMRDVMNGLPDDPIDDIDVDLDKISNQNPDL